MALYYKTKDGKYVDEYDVASAFNIVHGKSKIGNESEYLKFLWELLHSTLTFEPEPTIEKFIKAGRKIYAVKLYRDEHNCTVKEAKEIIDKMEQEMQI
ncbi:MAG: hypothetical protein NC548_12795 [Lachnospiraceae bacterium]|nr:hypothetical protein [Lachnospiraceae bacterium]MCM1230732.1 hypothetical protein [Ruminococcus flavefaciens]